MTGGDCVAARNVAAALFNTSIAGRSSAARHQFRKSLVSFAGSEAIVALYGVDPAYHVKRCAIEAVRAVNLSYPRTQPQGGVTWRHAQRL